MRNHIVFLTAIGLLVGRSLGAEAILPEPKANCKEGKIIDLLPVRTFTNKPGSKYILVDPFSIAFNCEPNAYVFDKALKKIFKINSSLKINRHANLKNKIKGVVFLKSGPNGDLFAYDPWGRQIFVFDKDLHWKYNHKEIPFISSHAISESGDIHFPRLTEGSLNFHSVVGKQVAVHEIKKFSWTFLFEKPKALGGTADENLFNVGLFFDYIDSHNLLIYSKFDSSLTIVEVGNKVVAQRLLPELALASYKKKLEAVKNDQEQPLITLFFNVFFNSSEKLLYLQHGLDPSGKKNLLYVFDLNGKLRKTYNVAGKKNVYLDFKGKSGDFFWVIENKKIKLLKEG